MKSQLIACAVLTVSAFAQRMTEVQIIGSHNSYHAGLAPAELANLKKANPKLAESLDYAHPSITKQLDMGVRKLELDIFSDTKGGLFAKPKTAVPDPPFDPQGLMLKPGFKVIHVQDLDFRSTCQPFTGCLAELRQWSKATPPLTYLRAHRNQDWQPATGIHGHTGACYRRNPQPSGCRNPQRI